LLIVATTSGDSRDTGRSKQYASFRRSSLNHP
jgi:hypothetical protein